MEDQLNLSLKGRQLELHRITEQVADDEDYRRDDSYQNNNTPEESKTRQAAKSEKED